MPLLPPFQQLPPKASPLPYSDTAPDAPAIIDGQGFAVDNDMAPYGLRLRSGCGCSAAGWATSVFLGGDRTRSTITH